MMHHPRAEKVVRYSSLWNANIFDDAATPFFLPADMELDTGDTTSQIYLPPFTLFPPELLDDFIIDFNVEGFARCVATSDTPQLEIWIRTLDTKYGYPVDATGGQAPIAGGKHVDILKHTVTLPSPTSLGYPGSNLADYGITLNMRLHVHNGNPWVLTDNGASPNGYTRVYDPDDESQANGSMCRIMSTLEVVAGYRPRPLINNNTNISTAANRQFFTHAFSSRIEGGNRQDLYPRDGGAGMNLWLMMKKTSADGTIGLISALIHSTPKVLRPGMVAGHTAIPFLSESEVIS